MELRLAQLLSLDRISLGASPAERGEAIEGLLSLHHGSGVLLDREQYRADVLLREAEGSTALGRHLAIPHAKSAGVRTPALAAMTAPCGVDWDAPDQGWARLLFMIAAPAEGGDLHLQILARLMRVLIHDDLPRRLMAAQTAAEFYEAVAAEERLVFPENTDDGGSIHGQ